METKTATVHTSGATSSQKSLWYIVPYIASTTDSHSGDEGSDLPLPEATHYKG